MCLGVLSVHICIHTAVTIPAIKMARESGWPLKNIGGHRSFPPFRLSILLLICFPPLCNTSILHGSDTVVSTTITHID